MFTYQASNDLRTRIYNSTSYNGSREQLEMVYLYIKTWCNMRVPNFVYTPSCMIQCIYINCVSLVTPVEIGDEYCSKQWYDLVWYQLPGSLSYQTIPLLISTFEYIFNDFLVEIYAKVVLVLSIVVVITRHHLINCSMWWRTFLRIIACSRKFITCCWYYDQMLDRRSHLHHKRVIDARYNGDITLCGWQWWSYHLGNRITIQPTDSSGQTTYLSALEIYCNLRS